MDPRIGRCQGANGKQAARLLMSVVVTVGMSAEDVIDCLISVVNDFGSDALQTDDMT